METETESLPPAQEARAGMARANRNRLLSNNFMLFLHAFAPYLYSSFGVFPFSFREMGVLFHESDIAIPLFNAKNGLFREMILRKGRYGVK